MPFSIEQFFEVFRNYNAGIWPAQLFAYVLGLAAVGLAFRPSVSGSRVVLAILALFWFWTGIGYHLLYFSVINPAAFVFAAVFVLQGILFSAAAARADPPRFDLGSRVRGSAGGLLIFYSLIVYPGLGYVFGHGGLLGPQFGVTPCPVTIFTMGLLLSQTGRYRWWMFVIPVWWALVGTSAAVLLGVPEDLMLGLTALLAIAFLKIFRQPKAKTARAEHGR